VHAVALNSTAACVLGLLDIGPAPPWRERWEADGTMSAADVWESVDRSVGGFWSMTRSQVYAELRRLADTGLVAADAGRYRITPDGRATAREWFTDFARAEPRDDSLRSPVTLSVFFGHYLPSELLERVVREHQLRYQRRLDTLRTISAALDHDRSLPGSTLQRALFTLGATIEWTRDVLDRIAGARADGERDQPSPQKSRRRARS
jgi:DNA-binding PadR family transcriptional regulator